MLGQLLTRRKPNTAGEFTLLFSVFAFCLILIGSSDDLKEVWPLLGTTFLTDFFRLLFVGVSAEGGVNQAFVDVAQLQRIKVGDFLQAAL